MKKTSRKTLLAAVLCLGLGTIPVAAVPYTFDVDSAGFGQGWFSMDLPDSWGGIQWGSFHGTLWMQPTEGEGSYTATFAGPEPALHVPWRGVKVGFFNNPGFQTEAPIVDSARLFTFTDRILGGPEELIWAGSNLQSGIAFGATPLEAILGIEGVQLRRMALAAAVPDIGGSLLLLALACGALAVFGRLGTPVPH